MSSRVSMYLALLQFIIGWTLAKDINVFGKCWIVVNGRCPDNSNIRIRLYTKETPQGNQVLLADNKDNLGEISFDAKNPIKLIIPGFNTHLYERALKTMRQEYVKSKEELNVFEVDWSVLSRGGVCLPLSLRNTGHVGKCLGQLVTAIKRYDNNAYIHVVANGAGTHIANWLSRILQRSRQHIDRITGLNPAKPFIRTNSDPIKLDPGDADFVDVIHTMSFLQYQDRIGHIDIYMNPGGIHQPGCASEKDSFDCDRRRALEYFAESINSPVEHLAWPCDGFPHLIVGLCGPDPEVISVGEPCTDWSASVKWDHGLYIAYTAAEKPYALGYWNDTLFKEKGPKMRTDKLALISNSIMKHLTVIKEIMPDVVKESKFMRRIKSNINSKAEELKVKAKEGGLQQAKNVASKVLTRTATRLHLPGFRNLKAAEADKKTGKS